MNVRDEGHEGVKDEVSFCLRQMDGIVATSTKIRCRKEMQSGEWEVGERKDNEFNF